MSTSVFDHPWLGGLFAEDALSAALSPKATLAHMLRFEATYSRALGQVGIVPSDMAERVGEAIETAEISMGALRTGTLVDGMPVPDFVRQLKAQTDPGDHPAVHKGLTTQDVIDTALVLVLKDVNQVLETWLAEGESALADLAARHGQNALMGRTRMQAALPIKVADRIAVWRLPLAEYKTRLQQIRPRLEQLQFGGPVGTRGGLEDKGDQIAVYLARQLALGNPSKAWHAMRETIVEYAGLLSLISGSLGKMGMDIMLMAQQGVNDIGLKGGGGSSAMPHKQNPVLAELLVTLAKFNATQISGMHHTLVHEQERSGVAWTLEWMLLPSMIATTGRSLTCALQLVSRIETMGQAGEIS